MFRITSGASCAPKDGPHRLGSRRLLEDVLLIPSGCFGGPCFSKSPVSSTLALCVCLLPLGGLPHVWDHLRHELRSQRWPP